MNLVDDRWIPVIGADGNSFLASLEDIFGGGDSVADLAANPCQRIALMRLFICIAQAALDGPQDEDDWLDCRSRLGPAGLNYLKKWRERFNLFGDRAFLQVDGLEANANALADKLDLTLACGINPTLFDQAATPDGRTQESGLLALNVLIYAMFATCGMIGTSVWDGEKTTGTSEHAPCIEGSMLHTFLRSSTILDTIHSNLLSKEQICSLPNTSFGQPVWTLDRLSKGALSETSSSYLGRLVPIARAIRCSQGSSRVTLANAIEYPKYPVFREPFATVVQRKKGAQIHNTYLHVDLTKHAWRELGSILSLGKADEKGGSLALSHIRSFTSDHFDLWTGGVAASRAKVLDMREWSFSLRRSIIDTESLNRYQKGVDSANQACASLKHAVKTYITKCAVSKDSKMRDDVRATQLFWGITDQKCSILANWAYEIDDSPENPWEHVLHSAMRDAYEQACPHETPRQIQAYVQGLNSLNLFKFKKG